jgi:hypothetical protein
MALTFPGAPADGEVYAAPNGILYRWDAAGGLWLTWGIGINNAIISSTPPEDPVSGQLWWSDRLGQLFIWFVDETSSQWVPASPSPTLLIPPGLISDFGGLIVPPGWYLCDGALKSREEDAPLFTAIGTLHGEGDGESTFALPDLRGRVGAMRDGGSGRLTMLDDEVGATGGEEIHVLTASELPATGPFASWQAAGPSIVSIGDTGGSPLFNRDPGFTGGGHLNVQPTMLVNKIIKR